MFAIEYDSRDDGGPRLVGPFGSKPAADAWQKEFGPRTCSYCVVPLYVPDRPE